MKLDVKSIPVYMYRIYNVAVSLSLFIVVYMISHGKTLGLFAGRWRGISDCEWFKLSSDFLQSIHPLWSYGIYLLVVLGLTKIVIHVFPYLDDDEMQNGKSIKSVEDANHQFYPNYLAYFFVALSAQDKYSVLIVFLIMLILSYKSDSMLYNPLLVLFGYRYYLVVSENNKKSMIITKRILNPGTTEPLSFNNLKRINDNTFVEIKEDNI